MLVNGKIGELWNKSYDNDKNTSLVDVQVWITPFPTKPHIPPDKETSIYQYLYMSIYTDAILQLRLCNGLN